MNRWKQVLIIVLALVCLGCHKTANQVEQPMTSMEEEIRKLEADMQAEKSASEESPTAPAKEKAPVAETASVEADDALIDSLGKTGGEAKVEIINSLGERRNPKDVSA
jgi:hypothetical protein